MSLCSGGRGDDSRARRTAGGKPGEQAHTILIGAHNPQSRHTTLTRRNITRPLKGEKESQKPDKQINLSENVNFLFDIRTKGSLIVNKVLKVTRHNEHNDTMIGKSELNILFEIAARFKAGLPSVLKVVSVTGGSQFESFTIRLVGGAKNLLESWRSTCLAVGIILIYGACHTAAWNTHFPSNFEKWLWRVSSIIVAVLPTYYIVLSFFHLRDWYLASFFLWPWFSLFQICGTRKGKVIDSAILWVLIVAVILGRVFLLVESFISLRGLPEGSFRTTVWEDYWPHL